MSLPPPGYNRCVSTPSNDDGWVEPRFAYRRQTQRTQSVGDVVGGFFKSRYETPHKQLGRIAEQWQRLLPDEIVQHTALVGLRRGVLTVTVADSAVLFRLDRMLRESVLADLRSAANARINRVKLEQGKLP